MEILIVFFFIGVGHLALYFCPIFFPKNYKDNEIMAAFFAIEHYKRTGKLRKSLYEGTNNVH